MAIKEEKISNSVIYAFVRIFEQKEHAECFLRGDLRFGRIRAYKAYVDKNGEQRGDPFEGIVSWLQPNMVNIKYGDLVIPSEDIAAPIAIHSNEVLNKFALCLYAIHSGNTETITQETLDDFKRSLLIHEKSFGLGSYCVLITNAREFQNRVYSSLDGKINGGMARVNYFDEGLHFPRLPEKYDGMHKRATFSHQNEYRVIADFEIDDDYFTLSVGDLSDIGLITTPKEFNQKLEVELPLLDEVGQ
ncbi:MAG: hypothetical protein CMI04_02785 [Oceanospirillaceae bacterium]|nr:hypothetical protein [Oceanospirillaceae bacterium]|tara:strand:+ start:18894 stop:19631 length:738 start_codon:yes stop_codon:yes gene_type:complete